MTEEQWAELFPYAEALKEAETAYSAWGLCNDPTDFRKQIESRIEGEKLSVAVYQANIAFSMKCKELGL